MLKKIKQGLLKTAQTIGVSNIVGASEWRRDKLLILAYHGVSLVDEHLWSPTLFVPPEFLRRRFELIKKNRCTVLDLGEAVERLFDNSLPEKAVAITFDDGLFDFHQRALPIIKEFAFPTTLYQTTFYSVFNRPVFTVAGNYLLWKAGAQILDCSAIIGLNEKINLAAPNERERAHNLIVTFARENDFSAEQKDDLLARMAAHLGIDYEKFCASRVLQLMNADEISEVSRAGIDVQLHTHRHRVPLDEKLFRREIQDNRVLLQNATANSEIRHFCYPSGEYNPQFFPWLKTESVVSATTCETALATVKTNPLLLPRLVDTCPLSEIEFEGWLNGVSQFLPQRRNLGIER